MSHRDLAAFATCRSDKRWDSAPIFDLSCSKAHRQVQHQRAMYASHLEVLQQGLAAPF